MFTSALYNSIDDKEEVEKIYSRGNKSLDSASIKGRRSYHHRKATLNLKSNRNDPLFMFNSDCLKNPPLAVFEQLKYIIKSFPMHSLCYW